MKCRHCGCENDDRSKVCAECGKPLGEAAGEPADPSLTQPVMPVRQSIGDRLQGKGKTLGIAISLGCALVLGAIGYGAWRLGAFQGPVKEDSEQAGDTDADAETETQAETSTDEASTYTRPTEPWSKDEGTSDQGGTSSGGAPSGGSQGSYQNSNGANNGNSHSDAEQPTQDEPPAEEPAPKKEEEAPKEAEPEPTDDGMPMHESLSEYSWSEMAALADRIGSCASEQEAKDIARRHHLIDESGSLSDASLDVTLDDGTTMHMRLAGIWHDRADTPSGRAGLTFISKNIVGRHVYGDTETQEGGWGSSSLRSWMCSELLGAFPDELERSIRPA